MPSRRMREMGVDAVMVLFIYVIDAFTLVDIGAGKRLCSLRTFSLGTC